MHTTARERACSTDLVCFTKERWPCRALPHADAMAEPAPAATCALLCAGSRELQLAPATTRLANYHDAID
jgi:hypothetical protein